jgi:hypothetical protein
MKGPRLTVRPEALSPIRMLDPILLGGISGCSISYRRLRLGYREIFGYMPRRRVTTIESRLRIYGRIPPGYRAVHPATILGVFPLLTASWYGEDLLPSIVGRIYRKEQVLVGIRDTSANGPSSVSNSMILICNTSGSGSSAGTRWSNVTP